MIKIGKTLTVDPKTTSIRAYKYTDFPKGTWLSMEYVMPIDFDLVDVMVENKKKVVPAWFDGKNWIGLRLRKGDVLNRWKRNLEYS